MQQNQEMPDWSSFSLLPCVGLAWLRRIQLPSPHVAEIVEVLHGHVFCRSVAHRHGVSARSTANPLEPHLFEEQLERVRHALDVEIVAFLHRADDRLGQILKSEGALLHLEVLPDLRRGAGQLDRVVVLLLSLQVERDRGELPLPICARGRSSQQVARTCGLTDTIPPLATEVLAERRADAGLLDSILRVERVLPCDTLVRLLVELWCRVEAAVVAIWDELPSFLVIFRVDTLLDPHHKALLELLPLVLTCWRLAQSEEPARRPRAPCTRGSSGRGAR